MGCHKGTRVGDETRQSVGARGAVSMLEKGSEEQNYVLRVSFGSVFRCCIFLSPTPSPFLLQTSANHPSMHPSMHRVNPITIITKTRTWPSRHCHYSTKPHYSHSSLCHLHMNERPFLWEMCCIRLTISHLQQSRLFFFSFFGEGTVDVEDDEGSTVTYVLGGAAVNLSVLWLCCVAGG